MSTGRPRKSSGDSEARRATSGWAKGASILRIRLSEPAEVSLPVLSPIYSTDFWFQHHARLHPSTEGAHIKLVSLFSNGANQFLAKADTARGLVLRLDTEQMTAELEREYLPSFHHVCSSEGSMQLLDNGNVLVGWGIGMCACQSAWKAILSASVQSPGSPSTQKTANCCTTSSLGRLTAKRGTITRIASTR